MRRSYQHGALVLALPALAAPTLHAKTIQPRHDFPAVVISCTLPGDHEAREWRVEQRGATGAFVLTLRVAGGAAAIAELPLAAPELLRAEGRLLFSSESANGGATVAIQASPAGALLDVFVNHELEVNVHRDLRPEVERMNTHGPRRDARCTLPPAGAR